MNSQEVFTKVAKHLLTQNKQSHQPKDPGACMYYAGQLRCAIGCLIPKKLYDKDMEAKDVNGLLENFPDTMRKILGPNFMRLGPLLSELQDIHDDLDPPLWRDALKDTARHKRLKMPLVKEKK